MKHNTHTERPLGGIVDIIPPPFRRRGLRVAATLLLRALLNLVGLAVLLPVLVLVLDPAGSKAAAPSPAPTPSRASRRPAASPWPSAGASSPSSSSSRC